ncbi:sensor histidine kinase, partial [Salinivirga cyanobacteriivorans]
VDKKIYRTENKTNKDFITALPKCDGNFREINIKTAQGDKWHNWACFNTPVNETILAGFDITPIYQNQKRLAESNATKDKILSVVSHDLHGPFNTIIGFSKILLSNEGKLSKDKRDRYLQHIHNSSKSMHTMLTNLLSWARAQSGKIKLYFTVVELYLLTSEVVKTLSPLAAQKKIKLINEIETGLTLTSDISLLRIIVQNLVANGIKFTKPGGCVEVSARLSAGNKIEIIVTDSGVGMSADMVEKINSGEKVESSPGTNKESGTGLGLLICQEFITYLDGTLKVKSHPDEGSSFIVNLPVHYE